MNKPLSTAVSPAGFSGTGEVMILPDGRILTHNLTPSLARLLSELDPSDSLMSRRSEIKRSGERKGLPQAVKART